MVSDQEHRGQRHAAVTEQQREQILALSRLSEQDKWIASQVGVSTSQVRRVRKRHLPVNDSTVKWAPELISNVVELALRKIDIREIATRLNTKPWKVHQICRAFLPKRQGRGIRISEEMKVSLRRELRQSLREISERRGISERALRKVLGLRRIS